MKSLRAQLAEKIAEIESLSHQLAQSSKEVDVKKGTLEDAEENR